MSGTTARHRRDRAVEGGRCYAEAIRCVRSSQCLRRSTCNPRVRAQFSPFRQHVARCNLALKITCQLTRHYMCPTSKRSTSKLAACTVHSDAPRGYAVRFRLERDAMNQMRSAHDALEPCGSPMGERRVQGECMGRAINSAGGLESAIAERGECLNVDGKSRLR